MHKCEIQSILLVKNICGASLNQRSDIGLYIDNTVLTDEKEWLFTADFAGN